ncbi:MAG TPA: hypothetical protein VJ654_14260 [Noviherbaspirillum sp.]|nr:hypothetical protein [Noviherbaspirillum sp.]
MARLSWRREPDEHGLAAVVQSPRGLELRYGGDRIADVSPVTGKDRWDVIGWYFTARSDEFGVPLMNTYGMQHWKSKDEAKAACDKYVRANFKDPGRNAK